MVASGKVNVHIDQSFALKDAGEAHDYLAARKSKGKVLLIP